MRHILVLIVAFLLPSTPSEGADNDWVATDYGGSCTGPAFEVQKDTIQVAEDGSFSFTFSFRELPGTSDLIGNLIKNEAEATNRHLSVDSFVSERLGKTWQIDVKWKFSSLALRLLGPPCHASFKLE